MFRDILANTIPAIRRLRMARDDLLKERGALAQQLERLATEARWSSVEPVNDGDRRFNRFFHYDACFNPEAVIRRHAVPNPRSRAGYVVNFLDVAIHPEILPDILNNLVGQVEGLPIPANWHADIAEWGAVLRAVDLAGRHFAVVELGCGWGCWLNNAGSAARRSGREVRLIGIEGDAGHLEFGRAATATNGFLSESVILLHGIAAAEAGTALFPRQHHAGGDWGLMPRLGVTEAEAAASLLSGTHDVVPMRPLSAIVPLGMRVDLLHVDIQGGEAALISESLAFLKENVAYIVVGTHSRQIEGALIAALEQSGWILEIERPAFLTQPDLLSGVTVDGVQGWRNPRLLPV